jgi:penicillin amidase
MVWLERHLVPALQVALLPQEPGSLGEIDYRTVRDLIREPARAAVVAATLDDAWADTSKMLGDDADDWTWGAIHQTTFRHPLQHLASGELASRMRFETYPRGGSSFTVNATGYYSMQLRTDHGASYRQVIDVGNWDAATMTNAPGQSGDPRSPFYDNLLEGWATDGSFPLIYSRDKVFEHKAFLIELLPVDGPVGSE